MSHRAAPLLSALIYALAVGLAVSALWGSDFGPDPARLAGLAGIAVLWLVGYRWFGGRFVRPRWKIVGKAAAALTLAYFAMVWLGPWGLALPVAHQAIGMAGHVVICQRHGIDWRTCEPQERYIALQEKWARGDFS